MDSAPALPPEIDQALERNCTVITANQRAARSLRRAYDLKLHAKGQPYWEPPSILAWDSWLLDLWHRLILAGHASDLLLSPTQEHAVWRAIIGADNATASLRPVDSLAETAADAWKLLHNYRGHDLFRNYAGNSDTRAFGRWLAEFERRCTHSRYLTQAKLPETLRISIAAGHLQTPAHIALVGFDSKTPAQTALVEALIAGGTAVDELQPAIGSADLRLVSTPGENNEVNACALWLRSRLMEQPHSRIAVIVPSIEDSRAEIDRIFREVLAPELNDITTPIGSGPFEFSLGSPLASTSIVAIALDLLGWTIQPLPLNRISALLLSPYFAAESAQSEHIARAEFDAFELRRRTLLQPQLSLQEFASFAWRAKRREQLPLLTQHLENFRTALRKSDLASQQTYAEWAGIIHTLLEAAGWAAPAHLDSIEFQTRRKWEDTLDTFATLDFENARVPFQTALSSLERIAAETLFAPESRHAPIQVMGPLESAGSSFDVIWFLRANDVAWPARSAPNPLLPWALQRDRGMPGAVPGDDAALARRITERIAASAPTAFFSYAHESAKGPQRLSPALSGLLLRPCSEGEVPEPSASPEPIPLEIVADEPRVPPPPDTVFPGGATVLQRQAECGFRAFAEHRLFSSSLDSSTLGLDARERGSLVHDVLDHFWERVQTQSALRGMTSAQRETALAQAIDAALARAHQEADAAWGLHYLETERQRLLNLLNPWLDYEASRSKPFTVKAREEKLDNVQIGPLHLDVRVDRVDEISTADAGSPAEIILDYKTGRSAPTDWQGDRPDAPQLPLYAVVSDRPNLAAIAFAHVRAGKDMKMIGYESQKGILPKSSKFDAATLADQVEQWRHVLESLAEGFHSGNATVSPKRYPDTCRYCQQRTLCRLDVLTLDAGALDELNTESQVPDSDEAEWEGERG